MAGTEQPIIPSPPACASIREVPTAVPFRRPNSDAAFVDNPWLTGSPGALTSLPSY